MAAATKLKVMLSSRCNDHFPLAPAKFSQPLSVARKALKAEIEALSVFGRKLFEVWINEDAPPASSSVDSWEKCLEQVRDCDILIVLSNGNAGWAKAAGEIGICHAEYMEGLSTARGKVWLVSLGNVSLAVDDQGIRNKRFQDYLAGQTAFRGGEIKTIKALTERVKEALMDAVVTLTQRGVHDAGSSRFDMGQALDWSRLGFRERKGAMEEILVDAVLGRKGSKRLSGGVAVQIAGTGVMIVCHAIPAALGISAARELVGQPFLRDHELSASLGVAIGGPLHVIACQKNATETQAIGLLGFPDATIVSGPFGVYVADKVQKVQFAFLVNCRDDTRTRHAAQRFFEWLEQTGEDVLLARRALARSRIVKAIAAEK